MSIKSKNTAPAKIPSEEIKTPLKPPPFSSILGKINEKQVAESMTPAAAPKNTSNLPWLTFLVKKTGIAPIPVRSPGTINPNIVNKNGSIFFIIKIPLQKF